MLNSTGSRSPLALVLVAATLLAASTAESAPSSGAAASATVDGTWSCHVPALNGYRAIKVDTARALGIAPAEATIATLLVDGFLAGIDAGPIGNNPGRVFVSRNCVRLKAATPLTRGDLSGPDSLQESYVCDATKRVLVRVKALVQGSLGRGAGLAGRQPEREGGDAGREDVRGTPARVCPARGQEGSALVRPDRLRARLRLASGSPAV